MGVLAGVSLFVLWFRCPGTGVWQTVLVGSFVMGAENPNDLDCVDVPHV